MYTITITIDDIDIQKLLNLLSKPKPVKADNSTLLKVMEITAPFIDKTAATIPSSAVAKLFNLFARKKLMDLAYEYGITVSELTAESE